MAAPLNSSRPARDLDAGSAAEQLAAMAAEIQQRDQLIEALTERLEEAAEQLDRIHRSGGDRGGRGGGPTAMPAEALEYLNSVAERTDQMVGEWTEVQAAHVLHRLDSRIESLVEMLRGGETPQTSGYTPPTSFLSHAAETTPVPVAAPPVVAEQSSGSVDIPEDAEVELKSPPRPIEEQVADPAKLHAAIREREDYITYLISEVRRRHPYRPVDWAAIQNAPGDLLARLQTLEKRLLNEVQKEELALSIERARMARERNELDKIKSRLEKEIRLLGGQPSAKEAEPAKAKSEEVAEPHGLRKLFGRKK